MARPAAPRYRTTNWRSYNAALRRRGSLEVWFDPQMAWFATPAGKRGRQPVFSDAAIQTCLMLKALFGLPLRQTTGLIASLIKVAGLGWPTPVFGTLCRRRKGLDVAIACRPAKGALRLLFDGDGEWSARRHGPSKPRQWRKVHLGVDADTLEIRAVAVTGSRVGDAPMLPLLDQIPKDQAIDTVTADGAFDTRACHAAIAARGVHVRNEALRAIRRFGRAIWRRWSGYHRRSRVETRMLCFKALGERLVSRDFERQVAGLHICVASPNRFTALGAPVTQRVA